MSLPELAPPSPPKRAKLGGYDFYRSIGSPRYIVAPMVDQSELAWRLLSRGPLPDNMAGPSTVVTGSTGRTYTRHVGGAHLCYTPMIHAKIFAQSKSGTGSRGGDGHFNLTDGEEGANVALAGVQAGDRPLFVQFCANDPELLLAAAKKVETHCDAVDINFGCPQGIAKRGYYGSFLQDDWELIKRLIGTLHENLAIPVTAKFRIFPDLERTLAYARMLEAAGAQILTCHGRTREMKGQMTGLADWQIIREVKKAVKVPVFANGNILYAEDVERCLEVTGCDGVMTAEGNLANPAIFLPPDHAHLHPPCTLLATRYLDIVDALKSPTSRSAIKAHLFRLLKPALDAQPDETLRQRISASRTNEDYRQIIADIDLAYKDEMAALGPSWRAPAVDLETGYKALPPWVVQPDIRPIPTVIDPVEGNANDSDPSLAAARAPSPAPAPASTSIHCSHVGCGAMAGLRCPHKVCITHCRMHGAREGANGLVVMAQDEIQRAGLRGGLEGYGCEAHEEKARARREREADRRAAKEAGKEKKRERVQANERRHAGGKGNETAKMNGKGKQNGRVGPRTVPKSRDAALEESGVNGIVEVSRGEKRAASAEPDREEDGKRRGQGDVRGMNGALRGEVGGLEEETSCEVKTASG